MIICLYLLKSNIFVTVSEDSRIFLKAMKVSEGRELAFDIEFLDSGDSPLTSVVGILDRFG